MKKTFIIPTRETNVLPNNNLYCKVYKNGGVNSELVHKFGIKPEYEEDCEWLLELSTEDINEYISFYYQYIIQQLYRNIVLRGNDYKEVETAIDTFTLLVEIKYLINYLDWHSTVKEYFSIISDKLKEYAIWTGDKSLLENLDFSPEYIRYWYNFNN